jgi:N-acetylneuraminate synthase
MMAGDKLTPENLRIIRPGHGLAPKHYDVLLGKKVSRAVKRGTPLTWDLIGD